METTIRQFKELGDIFAQYFRNLGYPQQKIISLTGRNYPGDGLFISLYIDSKFHSIRFNNVTVTSIGVDFRNDLTNEEIDATFEECGNWLKAFTPDQTPKEVKELREKRIAEIEKELSLLTAQEVSL